MHAVFKTGAHQYRVKPGDVVEIDKIVGDVGSKVVFDNVLATGAEDSIQFGKPYLPNAKVEAEIISQFRSEKVLILKYRRRKNSKKMRGHKQQLTRVEIKSVLA